MCAPRRISSNWSMSSLPTRRATAKILRRFWVKAERLLYCALIGYIWYEAEPEERNFITLLDLLNACEAREDDETYKSPVDILFDDLAKSSRITSPSSNMSNSKWRRAKLSRAFW